MIAGHRRLSSFHAWRLILQGTLVVAVTACSSSSAADAPGRTTAQAVIVTGGLSSDVAEKLKAAGIRGPTTLMVADSVAISNCEDLGRQLREFLHADRQRSANPIAVVPVADSALVARWLLRERIDVARIVTLQDRLLVGTTVVRGAAVLRLDGDARVVIGAIHPTSTPNIRVTSFAHELRAR